MTDITHEALIERGFVDNGEVLEKILSDLFSVEVKGETVWLNVGLPITVPNCRTLADLDNLIKLFV